VALAFSLPKFDGRDLIVMGTYAVVLFSLLVQAPTYAMVIRKLGLGTGRARREKKAAPR
jgi:monovalent cation:H+ antiporter, CPA1 family